MVVIVASRHMDVSPALKAYAEQKSSKLSRYYDRIEEIEVVFDNSKNAKQGVCVEIIVSAEHRNMFIARHAKDGAYACLDECISKLERQLSEHKKKFRNRKHSGGKDKRVICPSAL